MSRLYYESSPVSEAGEIKPVAENAGRSAADYLEKVSKLIPAEVLAGYLTMSGLVSAIKSETLQDIFLWIVFGIGLVLTPIYLNAVADTGKPKTKHIVVSTIAFIVWAYVTTGQALSETICKDCYEPAIASIILIFFSFISSRISLK